MKREMSEKQIYDEIQRIVTKTNNLMGKLFVRKFYLLDLNRELEILVSSLCGNKYRDLAETLISSKTSQNGIDHNTRRMNSRFRLMISELPVLRCTIASARKMYDHQANV